MECRENFECNLELMQKISMIRRVNSFAVNTFGSWNSRFFRKKKKNCCFESHKSRYSWFREFQKRGLLHKHPLLILVEENKIRELVTVDRIVSSELLDETPDSRFHRIVKTTMIHRPCSVLNPISSCMAGDVCTKGYS